ncbi:MAG: 23S rRNA (uracil(1939)-C(5))-methyltransferase RlmD [Lachnospiraceae bacterium]|nr:23S rRNA (uracil(1939)-C(5))-methyltransferase RlmD [Lachnospiraceae bacterium]
MQKNEIITVKITDLTENGEGVGRSGAFPLFIKDAVPGDTVRCTVTRLKKTYGYGHLTEVLEPSVDRVPARCPLAKRCGGCRLQALSYEAQLAWKQAKVKNDLLRIGGLDIDVPPVLGMQEPWRYRNKAQIPFGYDKNGQLVSGYYAERSHEIIPMEDCLLSPPEFSLLTRIVRAWLQKNGLTAYRETEGSGFLRHLLLRKSFSTGELMVCLVVNTPFPEDARLKEELIAAFSGVPGFATLTVNLNRKQTNVILGERTETLCGPGFITDTIGGVRFRISPNSFYQVNPVQTAVLYGKALEYAALKGSENVLDLYCGIGTISLFLAKQAGKVLGIEIVPQAVADAEENARLNGIGNAEFLLGSAEEVLPAWYSAHPDEKIDVITLDPPRKGCDPRLVETVLRIRPERIVYVSCDSATLARDLRIFTASGYEVGKVQPVDMFPQSCHVETVVLLSQQKPKDQIVVDLDLSELDLTSAEAKATYKEIQDYVLKKYGLKVSNLYVSQIKRKCGLEMGQNYNLSKSDNARVPTCPPEKEAAIMDALRNFKMI